MSASPQQYFVGGCISTMLHDAKRAGLAVMEIEQTIEPTAFLLTFTNRVRVLITVETLT